MLQEEKYFKKMSQLQEMMREEKEGVQNACLTIIKR